MEPRASPQVPCGGVPLPRGTWDRVQSLAPGQESSVLGKCSQRWDMPCPHSLGEGRSLLASWKINEAELGRRGRTLQRGASE